MSKVQELLKKNAEQSQSTRDISSVNVLVTAIIPVANDKCPKDSQGNIIPKSQIKTQAHGTFWALSNVIKHQPESFVKAQECKLTVEAVNVETSEGPKDVLNVIRAEFEVQEWEKIERIAQAGGALYSA
ncbi:MAG: hypothetical protein E6R13_10265 [Spirochaetes bacterium]|nr:MAG: hypothetical protein E6R13_10265 [Spirochaetota bacterium]